MTPNIANTANGAYLELLRTMIGPGTILSKPRDQHTAEIIAYVSCVDMRSPIVTLPDRNLDYNFMAAEAHWILRGEKSLDHPVLERNLSKYSDDGKTMSGAYGPPFVEQLQYVVDKLKEDRDTRQAVMTLWRRKPKASKDIPCTVSIQFIPRKGRMHTNVFMRSSDAWLGWPYDIFTFTMMTHMVRCQFDKTLDMGALQLFAGSQHLYSRKFQDAKLVVNQAVGGMILAIDNARVNTPASIMCALDTIRTVHSELALPQIKALLCQ